MTSRSHSSSSSTSPSSNASYSRPTNLRPRPSPVAPPATFLPLYPPPSHSTSTSHYPIHSPALPSRPALPPPPPGWSSTQHVVPAAYPRTFRESTGTLSRESKPFRKAPPGQEHGKPLSKEERQERVLAEVHESLKARYGVTEWTEEEIRDGKPGALWIAAERWVREDLARGSERGDGGEEGFTLVITHANGFAKESWHPTLHRLLTLPPLSTSSTFGSSSGNSAPFTESPSKPTSPTSPPDSRCGPRIDEIWLLDDIHHAASIDLNEGLLGRVHNWQDGGRDVVNFIRHVMPVEPGSAAETNVPWRETDASVKDAHGGRKRRKIVGVGHSFGGNAIVQAAANHPDLFHSLFLVEPMCPPISSPPPTDGSIPSTLRLIQGALKRRDHWSSVAHAADSVRPSPFFANWTEESFHIWKTHHLVPLQASSSSTSTGEDGGVQLATPSWAEACVFTEPYGLGQGWDALAKLETMPVGFVMAGDARATQGEEVTAEMVWRPKRASNERIMSAGHLVVQEKPDEVADALWRFLGSVSSDSPGSGTSDSKINAKL